MNKSDDFWAALAANMPVTFPRRRVSELTGGLLSAKVMANLDSQGKGPSIKVVIGKHVNYERINFLDWLKSRSFSTTDNHITMAPLGNAHSAISRSHQC